MNCDVRIRNSSEKRQKRPFWKKSKIKTEQRDTLRKQLRSLREKRKYEIVLAETAPSCNDCIATIVARSFTATMKGRSQPFGEEIRVLFPLIQKSGGVAGLGFKLFFTTFSFPIMS